MAAIDLSRVKDRNALKPAREPYWQRLRMGCFLGFRPSKKKDSGTWIGRAYDEAQRRYRTKSFGDLGYLPGKEQFAAAKREAEHFAAMVESGASSRSKIETVEDACRDYAASRPDAQGRFRRLIYGAELGKVKLNKLRRHHLAEWRRLLADRPALVSRSRRAPARTRPRSPSSINRDMAVLRAALNKVIPPGAPGSEAAWQEALRAIKNADRQRTLYLDREQRQALLGQVESQAQPFISALCLLPLRPGAVAQLLVSHFDDRTRELTIGRDKNGKPRRIVLPQQASKLLAAQSEGRQADRPIFTQENGKPWDRHTWRRPVAQGAERANLPPGVTAYTLRHSTITDLVLVGLPLLTVAQISGTSAEMIERHYGHLNRQVASEALASLEL